MMKQKILKIRMRMESIDQNFIKRDKEIKKSGENLIFFIRILIQ